MDNRLPPATSGGGGGGGGGGEAPDDEGVAPRPWDPRTRPLEEGEVLDYDSSAYVLHHVLGVEWPCLSFDILRVPAFARGCGGAGGGGRPRQFPVSAALVTATQAPPGVQNKLSVLRLTRMHKTQYDDASDSDSDCEEDFGADAEVAARSVDHPGGANRVRSMPQAPHVVATMADTGAAHVWDLRGLMRELEIGAQVAREAADIGLGSGGGAGGGGDVGGGGGGGGSVASASTASAAAQDGELADVQLAPLQTFTEHTAEGFAVAWSGVNEGHLLTGDCHRNIHLWSPVASSSRWVVGRQSFTGHTASVEDLQWSPTERTVFASCSVDQSVRVWDARSNTRSQLALEHAHGTDVNVISWNPVATYLFASGADDGGVKIWDLRMLRTGAALAQLAWHSEPVTSLEWHPGADGSVLVVAAADDSVTWWDMSCDADDDVGVPGVGEEASVDVPPQLLFVHRGTRNVKEVHFHPQLHGVAIATGESGFSIFKPANVDPSVEHEA